MKATGHETYFAAAGCTGGAVSTDQGVDNATFVGIKTIGTETVDKIDVTPSTPGAQTVKQVFAVLNGQLAVGLSAQDNGPVDALGYPSSLDPERLTRLSNATALPAHTSD